MVDQAPTGKVNTDLEQQIATLRDCKPLPKAQVQELAEKVSNRPSILD